MSDRIRYYTSDRIRLASKSEQAGDQGCDEKRQKTKKKRKKKICWPLKSISREGAVSHEIEETIKSSITSAQETSQSELNSCCVVYEIAAVLNAS
ncbi:hypothetical protein QVD17_13021 [Tagetes erecta]|uniref:Uncharacterized protein n=1 Tax=Tagetes erecta TaxID=13708 RepID=A0AAD8KVF3_TARER|nr:hypothetical protein QVD17_13021 [Tagetes erecta]